MRVLTALFALLVTACNSTPTAPVRDATIVVRHGSTHLVNDDLRVTFAEVVDDSRCPASVTCVWEGNGAIRLEITTGRGKQSVTLNTAGGTSFPREATAAGYTFTLVQLEPARQTPDPVPAQQYRATIQVKGA